MPRVRVRPCVARPRIRAGFGSSSRLKPMRCASCAARASTPSRSKPLGSRLLMRCEHAAASSNAASSTISLNRGHPGARTHPAGTPGGCCCRARDARSCAHVGGEPRRGLGVGWSRHHGHAPRLCERMPGVRGRRLGHGQHAGDHRERQRGPQQRRDSIEPCTCSLRTQRSAPDPVQLRYLCTPSPGTDERNIHLQAGGTMS